MRAITEAEHVAMHFTVTKDGLRHLDGKWLRTPYIYGRGRLVDMPGEGLIFEALVLARLNCRPLPFGIPPALVWEAGPDEAVANIVHQVWDMYDGRLIWRDLHDGMFCVTEHIEYVPAGFVRSPIRFGGRPLNLLAYDVIHLLTAGHWPWRNEPLPVDDEEDEWD